VKITFEENYLQGETVGYFTEKNSSSIMTSHISPATFATIVRDFVPGEYDKKRIMKVAGTVIDKVRKSGFVMYKIRYEDQDQVLRVLCRADEWNSPVKGFSDAHSFIDLDDDVIVEGYPGVSARDNPVIRCSNMEVVAYDNETDSEYDDSDPDYVEEESETSDTETEVSEVLSANPGQKTVTWNEIPLTICRENVIYQGRSIQIRCIDTTTPLQILIDTEIGDFVVSQMIPGKFVGVFVPPTSLEPDFKWGYDLLIRDDFENVIRALF
jgi:hypothetical protein